MIETATGACSVALFADHTLVDSCHEVIGRGHAERLIPLIAALPDGGRAEHILVSCGPGSFTGIRVGVAAARGLGLGWGAAVSGYSTLAAIAAQAFTEDAADEIGVAMLGGHGEIFVQSFQRDGIAAQSLLESLAPADAAQRLGATHVVGSAAAQLSAIRGFGTWADAEVSATSASLLPPHLLSLSPHPIYGRGADATPMA